MAAEVFSISLPPEVAKIAQMLRQRRQLSAVCREALSQYAKDHRMVVG